MAEWRRLDMPVLKASGNAVDARIPLRNAYDSSVEDNNTPIMLQKSLLKNQIIYTQNYGGIRINILSYSHILKGHFTKKCPFFYLIKKYFLIDKCSSKDISGSRN